MTALDRPTSRRNLIKRAVAAGGVFWAVPVIDSLVMPAAATSGSATAGLFKSGSGSGDPSLESLCTGGAQTTVGRGSVTFTRSESPATICVTITLTTGADVTGRSIFILQSTGPTSCVGGQVTAVGTWAVSPAAGPQTFCAPIVGSATRFVVAQQLSGGGGNDGWSSSPVSLP